MSTTKDIAKTLAEKHGIPQADAEIFLQQLVDTVNEGLLADRIVKIKSFGTFKLQSVKDRISVNVNTGEKVNIAGHDKVNFLPDALMKDVVNKPFAQFETVILDDTVIDDTPAEDLQNAEEPEEEELGEEELEEVMAEEPVTEELPEESVNEESAEEAMNETAVTEEPQESVEESHGAEEEQSDKSYAEEDCQTKEIAEPEESMCPVVRKSCRNYFIYVALMINVIVAVVAFLAGYYASEENWMSGTQKPAKTTKPVKATPTKKAALAAPKPKATEKDTANSSRQPAPQQTKKDTMATPRDTVARTTSYTADPRVRTGAYVITGVAQTVKVKKGQTLESISKHYLGPDMECYVEAVNNGKKTVNVGEELNIPTLRLKKKK